MTSPSRRQFGALYTTVAVIAGQLSLAAGSSASDEGALQSQPAFDQWNVDRGGSWQTGANWSTLSPPIAGQVAVLGNKITAPRTINLDGNKNILGLQMSASRSYTLAPGTGGSLTIGEEGLAVFASATVRHVIDVPLLFSSDSSIYLSGEADLQLGASISIPADKTLTLQSNELLPIAPPPVPLVIAVPQLHEPGAKVSFAGGVLELNTDAGRAASSTSAAVANLSLEFALSDAGGVKNFEILRLGSSQHLKELSVIYYSLAIDGLETGIDLRSPSAPGAYHGLYVYAADLDATKAALWTAIRNTVVKPRNGIFDSGLHAGAAVGIAIVPDEHGELNVTVRSTRIGDLNLDGAVTISDFMELASNFGNDGATWQEGDLNYDGSATIADFIDLASNFNTTYAGETLPVTAADIRLINDFAEAHGAVVPEPVSLLLLPLSFIALRRGGMGKRTRLPVSAG